jgi:hypothetical protein
MRRFCSDNRDHLRVLFGSSVAYAQTYVDTGLMGSTQYTYTVKAIDAAGNVSPASNAVVVTTPAPPGASNLVTQATTDLSDPSWWVYTTGSGTVSKTGASGTAPDNTNTATLVTINRSGTQYYGYGNSAVTGARFTFQNGVYTGSIWLKANGAGDVGKVIQLTLSDGFTYYYVDVTVQDTTAPTVSLTAPSSGATVSGTSVTLSATSSDAVGVAGVQFKLDGSNVGSTGTTSPYSITWNSKSVSDGTHTIAAVAHDAALNYATSSISVTVHNDPPAISSISSGSPTPTSATITWTTDEAATSLINYGSTTSYGTASSSATLATSHSITLTGLTASTVYHFQVQSVDGLGNIATSTDQMFTTASSYAGPGDVVSGALAWWGLALSWRWVCGRNPPRHRRCL